MKTSLNEIRQTERYLFQQLAPQEALAFEARTILDAELAEKVACQRKVYAAVKQYGRKKLKEEITSVERQLFGAPEHLGFRHKIYRLFNS